jgi:hypothetical protein
VHEEWFTIDATKDKTDMTFDLAEAYDRMPNGGVWTLRIESLAPGMTDCVEGFEDPTLGTVRVSYCFERLIFVQPKRTVPISITHDKKSYEPGDTVTININVDIPE